MKKILIIEDNLEVRENTAEILTLSNYDVVEAENGKLGVQLALSTLPDLIVCDIMMPVLDGYGVYHLLSKHSETAMIPFIFLTAKSEKSDFRKGMDMGIDDYITKPFEGIELLTAIETRLTKFADLKQQYSGSSSLSTFLDDVEHSGKLQLGSDNREVNYYPNKSFIYTARQFPRAMFHVISGKVKVSRTNEDGKEFITDIFSAGEYFGYTSMMDNCMYKDDAQALEETRLMLIPKDDFLQLLTHNITVAHLFIKMITQNIASKEDALLNLAYNSLRKKVAYGLIRLQEKYKAAESAATPLNLSRDNMARSFGIATESLIRTLSDFKEEKLIEINAGKVIILNERKLADLRS